MGFKLFKPKTWRIGTKGKGRKGRKWWHDITPWTDQSMQEQGAAFNRSKLGKGLNAIGDAMLDEGWNAMMRGRSGNTFDYAGKYKGKDERKGWDYASGDMQEYANKSLGSVMEQFKGGPSGRYGVGSSLKESGVDYGFDPTSGQSLGESLARAAFEQDVKGQISQGPETDIYNQQYVGSSYGDNPYAEVDEGDIEDYWKEWYDDERKEGFGNMGNLLALNQYDVSQMDPGAKKWSDIANPQLAEAGDVFREGMGSIYSGLGDLRTGSSARRREDLMARHGQNVLGIRGDVAGQRRQYQDQTLAGIVNAFNQYS